jgi:isopenicillin N synthase-like dioxygenase
VINIADCMARWTNDVFQSTIHRAINRSGVERYSVPMFFGVDYECTIEVYIPPYSETDLNIQTLPSCVDNDRPAKYKAVVVGDWVRSRLEGGYNLPEPGRMEGSEGCNSD